MARHETDRLWAYAGGELPPAQRAQVDEHLRTCASCALSLAQVKAARSLVAAPDVPPLPAARWSDIDRKVFAAAKRELARPWWLSVLYGPGFWVPAALAACALLLFAFWPRPEPGGLAEPKVAVSPPKAVPAVSPQTPARPVEPAAAPRLARVVQARAAGSLAVNDGVTPGTTVGTEKKGELWLSFPDGSRAGVLGGSRLTLAQVEPARVHLRLEQGRMLVEAAHVPGRAFEVNAGEVDIRVAGTRFLVERIEGRVLVAVSEGAVEVVSGERLYRVPAGQSLTVEKNKASPGKLGPRDEDELSLLLPLPRRAPRPGVRPADAVPDEGSRAFDAGGDAGAEAEGPAPDAGAATDSDFVAYPGPSTQAPPPSPAPVPDAAVSLAPADEAQDAGEPNLLQRLLGFNIDSPFPPLGMSMEEYRLKSLQKLADVGQCELALARSDAWLEAYPGNGTPKRFELQAARA